MGENEIKAQSQGYIYRELTEKVKEILKPGTWKSDWMLPLLRVR